MFPIFTVYVTSLVQNANKKREEYYNKEQVAQDKTAASSETTNKDISSPKQT